MFHDFLKAEAFFRLPQRSEEASQTTSGAAPAAVPAAGAGAAARVSFSVKLYQIQVFYEIL